MIYICQDAQTDEVSQVLDVTDLKLFLEPAEAPFKQTPSQSNYTNPQNLPRHKTVNTNPGASSWRQGENNEL